MKFLLASDMDGTVIPLEDTEERRQAIAKFRKLTEEHPNLTLAYITGRRLELAREGIAQWQLPEPDAIVGNVGTSVYWQHSGDYVADEQYAELMMQQMGGFTGIRVRKILNLLPDLTLQEPECQSDYKSSYYVPLSTNKDALIQNIRVPLQNEGITVNIVYSIDPHKQIGLVDILPADVAKDFALAYLADHCGIDNDHVVYAGDSGNDLKAFLSGYPAIAVSTTPEWVKEEVLASGTDKVYIAKAPSTAGVVEGCSHWGIF